MWSCALIILSEFVYEVPKGFQILEFSVCRTSSWPKRFGEPKFQLPTQYIFFRANRANPRSWGSSELGEFRPLFSRRICWFGKLNCADSPISGEKNNYCVAFKGEAVRVAQILRSTATAHDRRNFFSPKSCFLAIKSPKTWKSTTSLNQYFPHIPYVACKKTNYRPKYK
jgi:hypothetical protein